MKYCTIDECEKPVHGKGLCYKHYSRFRRRGHFVAQSYTSHGETRKQNISEYVSYQSMRRRCLDKNFRAYSRYGGRGIKICDRWLESFSSFLEDMGNKPGPQYSLDRINTNGDYEATNCRWASYHQQNINRRNNSEHPGVSRRGDLWIASMMVDRKVILRRSFDTFEEALEARTKAEQKWLKN